MNLYRILSIIGIFLYLFSWTLEWRLWTMLQTWAFVCFYIVGFSYVRKELGGTGKDRKEIKVDCEEA